MHGFPKWGPGEHEGNERYRSFSLKRLSLPSSPSLLGEKLAKNLYFYLTRASASTDHCYRSILSVLWSQARFVWAASFVSHYVLQIWLYFKHIIPVTIDRYCCFKKVRLKDFVTSSFLFVSRFSLLLNHNKQMKKKWNEIQRRVQFVCLISWLQLKQNIK